MTREEFIAAYNIGHRDGKAGEYLPNDYDDIFHIEQETKTEWIDDLIVKVLEEVDGGTDDRYIRYADICERVEKSIREYYGAKMESEVRE